MHLAQNVFRVQLMLMLFITSLSWSISEDKYKVISDRIKPVGAVCLQGEDCASAPVVVASAEPRSGQAIYDKHCSVCHVAGVAGAPKFNDAAAWSERLVKGFETMYNNAVNGIGAMPAKGLCMDCTDDEFLAAVKYLSASE